MSVRRGPRTWQEAAIQAASEPIEMIGANAPKQDMKYVAKLKRSLSRNREEPAAKKQAGDIALPPPMTPRKQRSTPKWTKKLFKGLYSAVVTPLCEGAVSTTVIDSYAKFLVKDGVTGVFVSGTAGMSMSLSVAERKEVLEAWVKAGKKHGLEVLAHIGAQSLEDSKELAQHAESVGVAAISSMAPSFFKPATLDLLVDYTRQVAAEAPNTPYLYYHFPDITGVAFPLAQVMEALYPEVPTLRGAKFTSTHMWDLGDTQDFAKKKGIEFDIFNGFEGMTISALPLGVTAHIAIGFSAIAPVWNRMVRAYEAGKLDQAEAEQKTGREWFAMFSKICGLWQMTAATKIFLSERLGMEFGGMRAPQRDVTVEEEVALRKAWRQFVADHPNLHKHEGVINMATAQAKSAPKVPADFTQLPGAQGKLKDMIIKRAQTMASALEIELDDVLRVLPHLRGSGKLPKQHCGEVAKYIDHTLLKATATSKDIEKLCSEAVQHGFYAVCVNSSRVAECAHLLKETDIEVASVVGFPLGAMDARSKGRETAAAVAAGATEIDMVMNIGQMLEGKYAEVFEDISTVVAACKGKAIVKVIFETCLLKDEQIIDASILSALAEARFVKTSTGFSTGGATPEAVDIMKATVGDTCLVKASGGVKTMDIAKRYIAAGISRIGTSSGVAIIKGTAAGAGY